MDIYELKSMTQNSIHLTERSMKKMNQPNSAQQGFTLIELIMVIVILGILSAFALPKFADLSGNARTASIKAAQGAIKSSVAIAHAQWLAGGSSGTIVRLEGTDYTMVNGYPEAEEIVALADLSGYSTLVTTASSTTDGGEMWIAIGTTAGDECFIYTGGTTTGPTSASVGAMSTMASATVCTP
jgi:MSHA pilin protein MshA